MKQNKNIHVLATDKPSSLCLDSKDKLWFAKYSGYTIADGKQNIYITNSEEIKVGDYYYNERLNQIFQAIAKSGYNTVDKEFKIILTTDQDLIKDGVQAIDDEFLQWFVAHPSCQCVEVEKDVFFESVNYHFYKIIIPKEEPEQETLEEAAEIFFDKRAKEEGFENWTQIIVQQEWEFIESFPVEFAKWQQGRRYSDEEMYSALQKLRLVFKSGVKKWQEDFEFDLDKWFEQFKKK